MAAAPEVEAGVPDQPVGQWPLTAQGGQGLIAPLRQGAEGRFRCLQAVIARLQQQPFGLRGGDAPMARHGNPAGGEVGTPLEPFHGETFGLAQKLPGGCGQRFGGGVHKAAHLQSRAARAAPEQFQAGDRRPFADLLADRHQALGSREMPRLVHQGQSRAPIVLFHRGPLQLS